KFRRLTGAPEPYMYVPAGQFYRPDQSMWIHLKAAGPVKPIIDAVQSAIKRQDPSVAVFDILPMQEYMIFGFLVQKICATLLSILVGIAVLLAALGLYSVMAYWITQRTHEIGVRMALGAQPMHVLRMVLRRSVVLAGLGVAAGIVGALVSTRLTS